MDATQTCAPRKPRPSSSMASQPQPASKPVVLITGAAGDIGTTLAHVLARDFTVVGIEQKGKKASIPLIGLALIVASFAYADDGMAQVVSAACGMALVALSIPRGGFESRYGDWGAALTFKKEAGRRP